MTDRAHRPVKIAIFMEFFLPYLGGIERYQDRLSEQLRLLGYDVFIVTSLHDESLPRFEDKDGLRIYRLPTKKNLFKQRYPFFKRDARFKETMAAVEAENADFYIVNTRFHLTSLLGARLAHRLGRPVALIEHGTAHMSVGNPILDFFGGIYEHALTHFVKKHVTSYYGVSRNCNKWLRHFKIKASGVWYNAVTPEDTAVADNRYERQWPRGRADSEIVISYAGRLIAEKGIVALLDAFTRLRAELPDVPLRLAVAGSGPIEDDLHERYGSDPAVSFLGKLDFPAVMSLYRRSDIFVYPSMYPEGLPTSILEAALGDCAIIATPRGGTEEVITSPKLGWIVDGASSAQLTDALVPALREAVTDPARRASCAAAVGARVREHFTWASVARAVASAIDEAVDR